MSCPKSASAVKLSLSSTRVPSRCRVLARDAASSRRPNHQRCPSRSLAHRWPVPRPRRRGRIRQAPRHTPRELLTSTTDARSPNPQGHFAHSHDAKGPSPVASADSRSATRATSWTSPCNELRRRARDSRVGCLVDRGDENRAGSTRTGSGGWSQSERPSPRHVARRPRECSAQASVSRPMVWSSDSTS